MTTERPLPHPSPRVPGLRTALAVTAVLGALGAAVALVAGGRPQLLGVVLGVSLVAGFFVFGSVTTSVVAAFAPRISMLVALLTYTLQVVVLALVLVLLDRSHAAGDSLDVGWLAGSVVLGALGWTVALVADTLHRSEGLGETGVRR